MRSTMAAGIVETSWKPSGLMPRRLPLTSTRVRCAPRLRRSMYWPPASALAVSGEVRLNVGEPAEGMFCRMSATVLKPPAWMSSRLIITTGCAVSTSTWRMREPVTSMRSRVVACCSELSCANATPVPAITVAPDTSAKEIASRSLVVLRVISSLSK